MPPTGLRMTKVKDRMYLIVGSAPSNYLVGAMLPKERVIPYIVTRFALHPLLLLACIVGWELSSYNIVHKVCEPWLRNVHLEDLAMFLHKNRIWGRTARAAGGPGRNPEDCVWVICEKIPAELFSPRSSLNN